MKEFKCTKCESTDIFIEKVGTHTGLYGTHIGLYCSNCGKWITWLNKHNLRLAKRQIEQRNGNTMIKCSGEFGCNKCV